MATDNDIDLQLPISFIKHCEAKLSLKDNVYTDRACCWVSGVCKYVDEDAIHLDGQELTEAPKFNPTCHRATKLYLDYNILSHIQESIFEDLQKLTVCSLIGNDLEKLPESVGYLRNLEEFYLNENKLTEFPLSFSRLGRLKKLNIVGNMVKSLPADFGELGSLEEFDACENLLEELPESIGMLCELEVLELADNQLTSLPYNFGSLHSLRALNVSSNNLTGLPDSFTNLSHVKLLDISENAIDVLPEEFASAQVLEKLFFDGNPVTYLPHWTDNMLQLCELSGANNRLTGDVISHAFGINSQKLHILNMAGNYISNLPESIGNLNHLESLHMGSCIDELERRAFLNGNWMETLPKSFCQLTALKSLRLDENKIQCLPENFGALCNLETLDLGQNHLDHLPATFCKLRSLKVCQLSRNLLKTLPDDMHLMVGLRDLRLDNNKLETLPSSLGELTELETLDLFNNKLTIVPTFLYKLTALKRLDLYENNFKIKLKDIPRLNKKLTYPVRDPNLRNNWRGKERDNLREFDSWEVGELPDGEDPDDEQAVDQDPTFSEYMLERAVRHNMSMWRSHTGPAEREKFTRPIEEPEVLMPLLLNKVPPYNADAPDFECFGEGEDWNDDVPIISTESNDVDKERWQDADENEASSKYPYTNQMVNPDHVDPMHHYIPANMHVKELEFEEKSTNGVSLPEDGQFDDTEETSTWPSITMPLADYLKKNGFLKTKVDH